jgi:hypothetical protein
VRRSAVALEAGTTLLAFGGVQRNRIPAYLSTNVIAQSRLLGSGPGIPTYLAIDDIVSPTLYERRVLRQVLPEGASQTRIVELNLRYFDV